MAPVGRVLLVFAFLVTLYGLGASLYGGRHRDEAWIHSGRRAMYSLLLVTFVCFVILDVAFATSNFSYNIVAEGSSTTTPFSYRLAAIWATQQGSLLLWCMLLSGWASVALFVTRDKVREVVPWAQATLFGFSVFFVGLDLFFANPFGTTDPAPSEGAGLDPLLRHATMMIHPPMLYSGYTLMLVPFAFGVGALVSRRLNAEWVQVTRRFALAAWLCLGAGIVLGMLWSYTELGWGGYWEWDPVENAALMPWLIVTAYIHSIMIQEKRGMLKVWNASLVLLGGAMAIVGDFLVRSGILSSIHAFVSDPTLNFAFVGLIVVIVAGALYLVISRREQLQTEAHLDSIFSRESVFLVQNMVLVAIALVVFWVTFFPLISEAITGNEISVGPAAFRPYVVPLAIIVVALAGVGPIIPWRRVTPSRLRRNFAWPAAGGLAVLVGMFIISGTGHHLLADATFCFGGFVIATVLQEFIRGTRARSKMAGEAPPLALVRLVRRNRRRYGGYTVHFGIAVLLIGIAASTSFQHQRDAVLTPGQSVTVDGKQVTYVRPTASATPQKINFGSIMRVSKHGRTLATLHAVVSYYPGQNPLQPIGRFFASNDGASTESSVGLQTGALRDIWIAVRPDTSPLNGLINRGDRTFLKAIDSTARAKNMSAAERTRTLKTIYQERDQVIEVLTQRWVTHPWAAKFLIEVNPMVMWLWIGAIISAIGGLIALWPVPRRVRSRRGGSSSGARRRARAGTSGTTSAPARERELVAMIDTTTPRRSAT
jgi:cytochrome c-type biogenesis protein CcmF